jgi:predicted DNA binding CopG/RHH family protein
MELEQFSFQTILETKKAKNLNVKREKSKPISFRLSENDLELLQKKAKVLGVSIHQLAKSFVLESLEGKEKNNVMREIAEVFNEVEKLKFCLADATEAILVTNKYPKEKAKKWTTENIRQA